MSNLVTLWSSPDGVTIPRNTSEITELAPFFNMLTHRETQKIVGAFQSELYDMAAEYTWARTINVLREMVISSFGEEFILEMLGRTDGSSDISQISEIDVITLAADLGIINKTAKIQLVQFCELIKHYTSRDADDEMDKTIAQACIKSCLTYVLGKTHEGFHFSFNDFRNSLKQRIFKEDDEVYRTLITSPYFYKRTTVRTLLNLARKTPAGGELQNVFTNMTFIIPNIWEGLLSDDRWPIGYSYAKAVNEGNKEMVKALKSVLMKVKGFDYVPENLRSNAFIEAAEEVLKVHFGYDNFHHEPAAIKQLLVLGTSIPGLALGRCLTSTIVVRIGNKWGVSRNAQADAKEILDNMSNDRWEYFLNEVLPGNEIILYKLLEQSPCERWMNIVNEYLLDEMNFKNIRVAKLVQASKDGKVSQIRRYASEIIDSIRK